MQIPNNPEAQALLKQYEFHHLTSSYGRQELRKKFTAYNKANPQEQIQPAMIIADRFPTFYNSIKGMYPNTPEELLFEKNFGKLLCNLHIIPTKKSHKHAWKGTPYNTYDSMEPTTMRAAYRNKNITFNNSITGKDYKMDDQGYFISIDGKDQFSVYDLQQYLIVLREV